MNEHQAKVSASSPVIQKAVEEGTISKLMMTLRPICHQHAHSRATTAEEGAKHSWRSSPEK